VCFVISALFGLTFGGFSVAHGRYDEIVHEVTKQREYRSQGIGIVMPKEPITLHSGIQLIKLN